MEDNLTKKSETSFSASNLNIPLAIIIAGMLIAGAVYFSSRRGAVAVAPKTGAVAESIGGLESLRSLDDKDHIRGNPDATVKIIEYSDMECPFCKRFHLTMQQTVNEYGKEGKVTWVYRHFPLDQLHSKARAEAVATECATELGGNIAFWRYLDRFFELTPSNDQTNIQEVLPQIAREIGLDVGKFNTCLQSGKYDKHIQDDLDNATATGGRGTPWSIVVSKNGKKYPLSGAQPHEAVKQIIETALREE